MYRIHATHPHAHRIVPTWCLTLQCFIFVELPIAAAAEETPAEAAAEGGEAVAAEAEAPAASEAEAEAPAAEKDGADGVP